LSEEDEEEEEEQWEEWDEEEEAEAEEEEAWLPGDSRSDGAVEARARRKAGRSKTAASRAAPLRLVDLINMSATEKNELSMRRAVVLAAMQCDDEQSADNGETAGKRGRGRSEVVVNARMLIPPRCRCLLWFCIRIAASLNERNSKTGELLLHTNCSAKTRAHGSELTLAAG
jgi:hypothetical protein